MVRFLIPSTILLILLLNACTDAGYYLQCARGHLDLMSKCRPLDAVIDDPLTATAQRERLLEVRTARNFASHELALPDNGSYRRFADLGRKYVVWNVVAAPELSLVPKQWCFPVAGCVTYRGYFDESAARHEADRLAGEGYDVDVYGVQAYSTLRWFDDPVLNTFLDRSITTSAGLIFHELAHQVVYVDDDSRFNEAFARTVEVEGIRRWLLSGTDPGQWKRFCLQQKRVEEFNGMLDELREELNSIYGGSLSEDEKRHARQVVISSARSRYEQLKVSWGGYAGFDSWMDKGINNARLSSLATYRELVPAFQSMLAADGGDLPRFYQHVSALAKLPSAERLTVLQGFTASQSARLHGRLDHAGDRGGDGSIR